MIVTSVTVFVKTENIGEFITETTLNHKASIQEPGNLRFDVLQAQSDPSRFLLYEAYKTEEDARAHKETEHYKRWKDAVAPWMAKPREGVAHNVLCPSDSALWK